MEVSMETFGDVLSSYGDSQAEIARVAEVKPSTVSRWIKGEKLPDPFNRAGGERVERLQGHYCQQDQACRQRLWDALISSRNQRSQHRRSDHAESRISRTKRRKGPAGGVTNLPLDTEAYAGSHNSLAAAIKLLTSPPSHQPVPGGDILLSWQGDDLVRRVPNLAAAWRHALTEALRSGRTVRHLFRLSQDHERSVRLVETMLGLLWTDRYAPRYFETDQLLQPPYDLLVAPGDRGALLFLATTSADAVDSALYLHDPKQLEMVRQHFARLEEQTRSLLTTYRPDPTDNRVRREFRQALMAAEQQPGEQMLLQDVLSDLTWPHHWMDVGSICRNEIEQTVEDVEWLITYHHQRWDVFDQHIKAARQRHLCYQQAIIELADQGIYRRASRDQAPHFRLRPSERRDHLARILDLLKLDNYELGLLTPNALPVEQRLPARLFWKVIRFGHVLMERWVSGPLGEHI